VVAVCNPGAYARSLRLNGDRYGMGARIDALLDQRPERRWAAVDDVADRSRAGPVRAQLALDESDVSGGPIGKNLVGEIGEVAAGGRPLDRGAHHSL
jgi:hypothetical protein